LTIAAPAWPKLMDREPVLGTLTIQSGGLVLKEHPYEWGGFSVAAAGRQVVTGHNRPLIGYLDPAPAKSAVSPSVRWLDLAVAATVTTGLDPAREALFVEAQFRDPDGGQWQLRQICRPGSPAAIVVHTECSVDAPRDVFFLPLLLLLPGHGSFGALKGQALLTGVEYLVQGSQIRKPLRFRHRYCSERGGERAFAVAWATFLARLPAVRLVLGTSVGAGSP